MNLTVKQSIASVGVFIGILFMLMSVDDRVRDRFRDLASDGGGTWTARLADVSGILLSAAKHQSIENAPLVVFAVVGAVLFVFMVRT
jgi:hypothetical protein